MFNHNRRVVPDVLHIHALPHSIVFKWEIANFGKSKPSPNYPLDLISRF
jgi:hypothetical protein